MLILVKLFMSGENCVLNTDHIVRITEMKEQKGCVVYMSDGSKITISHSLEDLCKEFYVSSRLFGYGEL